MFRSWLLSWTWSRRPWLVKYMTIAVMIVIGGLFGSPPSARADWEAGVSAADPSPEPSAESPRFRRIGQLIPAWRDQCLNVEGDTASTDEQRALRQAIDVLSASPLGSWLIDQAARRSVMICLDHGTRLEAYYRAHLRLIGLNARLDPDGRLVFLAHELAHVPQHPHFSNNRRFSPENMLLLHRVREATAEAVATRLLWQLRDIGLHAPWHAKLRTAYGDIAELFEASMSKTSGEDAELRATRSAFYHWFEADWRLDIYDDLMLKTLARIADDPIGLLPSSRWLSDPYLRAISAYADDRFLIEGDGHHLMRSFGQGWQASGKQARLDLILDRDGLPGEQPVNSPESTEDASGLSASSSGPIPLTSGP